MRLEHANITVTNLRASVDFYSRLFDFEPRWQGVTELGHRAAHVGNRDTYLALFETRQPGRVEADYLAVGFNHVGFEVDDLDRYRQRLTDMGVPLEREEDYEPGRRLYFNDPDGLEIELVEY